MLDCDSSWKTETAAILLFCLKPSLSVRRYTQSRDKLSNVADMLERTEISVTEQDDVLQGELLLVLLLNILEGQLHNLMRVTQRRILPPEQLCLDRSVQDALEKLLVGECFHVDTPDHLKVVAGDLVLELQPSSNGLEVRLLQLGSKHHVEVHVHQIVEVPAGVTPKWKAQVFVCCLDFVTRIERSVLHLTEGVSHVILLAAALK